MSKQIHAMKPEENKLAIGKRSGSNWRILIVEDNDAILSLIKEVVPSFVDEPDKVDVIDFKNFNQAADRLTHEKFDLLILDLKDDSEDLGSQKESPAGLKIFETLKKTRFVPVVFYTALAHLVRSYETSFVRVVEKTENVTKVRDEVRRIMATRLPILSRQIEEIQREYMWDFVGAHWKDFHRPHEQVDLAYLLARRLALSLEKEARKLGRKMTGREIPMADPQNIHPMEMYIPPPVGKNRQAGDILKGSVGNASGYWLILTPSCDFEQAGRLHNILVAQCVPLEEQLEYKSWVENPAENGESLKALIGDNRKDAQPERFKFLPGTFFFPDSIVDFQRLLAVPPDEIAKLEAVASLDSPFAEAVLARFSRYFGRLGTPDLDKTVFLNRLELALRQNTSQKSAPDIKQ